MNEDTRRKVPTCCTVELHSAEREVITTKEDNQPTGGEAAGSTRGRSRDVATLVAFSRVAHRTRSYDQRSSGCPQGGALLGGKEGPPGAPLWTAFRQVLSTSVVKSARGSSRNVH